MPSSSKKQHNFMAAVAHNPSFAKRAGVSQSVGKDFVKADKDRKVAEGGNMRAAKMKAEPKRYARGGGIESKGKTNCKVVGMNKGGATPPPGGASAPGGSKPAPSSGGFWSRLFGGSSPTPSGGARDKQIRDAEERALSGKKQAKGGITKMAEGGRYPPSPRPRPRPRDDDEYPPGRPMPTPKPPPFPRPSPRPPIMRAEGGAMKGTSRGRKC